MLPFSGPLAATGFNVERVLILLAERVNQAGGIAGKRVELVATDSHSEDTRGLVAAQSLIDKGVIGVLGPESEDLAKLMNPMLDANDTLLISPNISSPSVISLNDRGFWFRIGPSTELFANSLATRIHKDGVSRLAVLYTHDEYGKGFASVLINAFKGLGGEVVALESLSLTRRSYPEAVQTVLASGATACALLAYPVNAAPVVSEALTESQRLSWYFAPPLRSDVFLMNAPLISGTGISSALDPSSDDFTNTFRERWDDVPLYESYAYYDGLALLLLASERAAASGIERLTGANVRGYLAEVSRPPGEVIRWNELERGLELVARGEDVNYDGVSGPADLSDEGDTPGASVRFWYTEGGVLIDL